MAPGCWRLGAGAAKALLAPCPAAALSLSHEVACGAAWAGGEATCQGDLRVRAQRSPTCPRRPFPTHPQNPRFLLLLRFINDVMGAVGIISSASSKTEEAAAATSAAAATGGAPAAGAVAAAGVTASHAGAAAAAAVGAAAGEAAAPAAAAASATAAAAKPGGSADLAPLPPLEVMVQLSNVGIVLPTSSSSTGSLAASVDELRLALPGASAGMAAAGPARTLLGSLLHASGQPACSAAPAPRRCTCVHPPTHTFPHTTLDHCGCRRRDARRGAGRLRAAAAGGHDAGGHPLVSPRRPAAGTPYCWHAHGRPAVAGTWLRGRVAALHAAWPRFMFVHAHFTPTPAPCSTHEFKYCGYNARQTEAKPSAAAASAAGAGAGAGS